MATEIDGPPAPEPAPTPPSRRHWYRVGLTATVLIIVAVLAALPIAAANMGSQLFVRGDDDHFDVLTGRVVTHADAVSTANRQSFFNIGVLDINEDSGAVTLGISGNRVCPGACPTSKMTLFALDEAADVRQGLPPSATLTLAPTDLLYTQSLQLPIRGNPSLYPFDTWDLKLGLAGGDVRPDGSIAPVSASEMAQRMVVTIQNQMRDFSMPPPTPIDPEAVRAPGDAEPFAAVQDLTFTRPLYLRLLSAILVALITVSGVLALLRGSIDELLIGIGGLVLGIWGVRSIVIPRPVPVVTAVDQALSLVILVLLLGLAFRVARHFHRHSDLPWPRR